MTGYTQTSNKTYLKLQPLKCVKSIMYCHSRPGEFGIEMAATPRMAILSYQATIYYVMDCVIHGRKTKQINKKNHLLSYWANLQVI